MKGIIEQYGGTWNGYTWIDQTTYLETASRDALDRMLFIEAERMSSCLYDPEDCESERTVIISELKGGENDPEQLLDIELPGRSCLDVISDLLQARPGCAVIVVTTFGRPGYLRRALEAGASGFLLKDDPVEGLAAAIRRVLAGEIVVNPQLATQALSAMPNPLSDRERQVLSASAGGATIADIAAGLHLSPSTVRNYLSSAIGKTSARNRVRR